MLFFYVQPLLLCCLLCTASYAMMFIDVYVQPLLLCCLLCTSSDAMMFIDVYEQTQLLCCLLCAQHYRCAVCYVQPLLTADCYVQPCLLYPGPAASHPLRTQADHSVWNSFSCRSCSLPRPPLPAVAASWQLGRQAVSSCLYWRAGWFCCKHLFNLFMCTV